MPIQSKEIRLKAYPKGYPNEEDFELVTLELPEPKKGEVLIKNLYMSVDPYMRGRMTPRKSYVPPFEVGKAMEGAAVGVVLKSLNPGLKEGEHVVSMLGFREYFLSDGSGLLKVDPNLAPIEAYLGVLGMTGLTAYVGLKRVAELKENERVLVSAASGAVGSIACQIAKIMGCTVVGTASSDEKCAWLLNELKIDKAINYKKAQNLPHSFAEALPEGIDVCFENVGDVFLEAALENMRDFGRVVLCGMIALYNLEEPKPGPSNLFLAITKRLKLQGFIVSDNLDMRDAFLADMTRWIQENRIVWRETVFGGIENAPKAFLGLFDSENIGKMLVKLA